MVINKANLIFKYRAPRKNTDLIILHHAAGSGSVEAVHAFHQNVRGWSGIAYNFYVRKDGTIWQGRGLEYVGGHSGSKYDSRSVGICAEGNFEIEEMSAAQKQSLIELIAYVIGKYPNAKIIRHKDIAATACPGRNYPFVEICDLARQLAREEAQESEKPTTPKPVTPAAGAFLALPVLRRGSKSDAVKALQMLLIGYGHNCGRWGADGSFGGGTDSAVRSFQKSIGLAVDGICGLNTWRKLLGV